MGHGHVTERQPPDWSGSFPPISSHVGLNIEWRLMAFWKKLNKSLGALKDYLGSSSDDQSSASDDQASDEEMLISAAEAAEAAETEETDTSNNNQGYIGDDGKQKFLLHL